MYTNEEFIQFLPYKIHQNLYVLAQVNWNLPEQINKF